MAQGKDDGSAHTNRGWRPSRRAALWTAGVATTAALAAGGTATYLYFTAPDDKTDPRFADSDSNINLGNPHKNRSPDELRLYYLELYNRLEESVDQIFTRLTEIGTDINKKKFPPYNPLKQGEGLIAILQGIRIEFCPEKPSPNKSNCNLFLTAELKKPEGKRDKPYEISSVANAFQIYTALCIVQNKMTREEAMHPLTEKDIKRIKALPPAIDPEKPLTPGKIDQLLVNISTATEEKSRLPEFPTGENLKKFVIDRFKKFKENLPEEDRKSMVDSEKDEDHMRETVTKLFDTACVYCGDVNPVNPHFKGEKPLQFDNIRQEIARSKNPEQVSFDHSYPIKFPPISIPYTITVIKPKEIMQGVVQANQDRTP